MEQADRRPAADRLRDLLAGEIARQVSADPSLLERAVEMMDGAVWRSDHEQEWRALIGEGLEAVVATLTSTAPDALALKADSPFTMLGIVDEAVRRRLVEAAYSRRPGS